MVEFYAWPKYLLIIISVLFAISVSTQGLVVFFSCYRHPLTPRRLWEDALEILVLVQIFCCSLLHGRVSMGNEFAMLTASGFENLRIILFFIGLILTLIVCWFNRIPYPLVVVFGCGLTLPVVETWSGYLFPFLFCFALFLWLLRGIHLNLLRTREVKNSISTWSIKNAVDQLPSGLMFYESDGVIVLINVQMQRLMQQLIGRVARNAKQFYAALIQGNCQPGCRKVELEGQIVYLMSDDSAWMFHQSDLLHRRKRYVQLTATDVTHRWVLTQELNQKNVQLQQRSEELKHIIDNAHDLSLTQELQKTKTRIHDVLGARLAIILRMLRTDEPIVSEDLSTLAEGILDALKSARDLPSPADKLNQLSETFSSIGVTLDITGDLPNVLLEGEVCSENKQRELDRYASLLVDIMREGITNAVRHGFATQIYVKLWHDQEGYHMKISDNGHPLSSYYKEGGGIGGMRQKLSDYGGKLTIDNTQGFVLIASLPDLEIIKGMSLDTKQRIADKTE